MTIPTIRYILPSMPKVTVYVRKEDYDKWKAVEEKTAFIHDALNPGVALIKKTLQTPNPVLKVPFPYYEAVEDLQVNLKEIALDLTRCKHGADPRFCKFAKPGKPCK